MANANTYIGINHGASGTDAADFTIQGSAPSTDFYFYFAAVDGQSVTLTRLDALLALEKIERVLESMDIFTTEMAQ